MKKVSSGSIASKISIPNSKSFCNRALILAARTPGPVTVYGVPESTDVQNLLTLYREIGLELKQVGTNVTVENCFPECEPISSKMVELDLGDGGTTARFFIALLSLGGGLYKLTAKQRMKSRPMKELYAALSEMSVRVEQEGDDSFPIILKGPAFPSDIIKVDSERSTQFASALMLAYGSEKVQEINQKGSRTYLNLTKKLVQEYEAGKKEYLVPPDFSSLSYPAVFAVLTQDILVKNCKSLDELQSDSALFDLFSQLGIDYNFSAEGLSIKKAPKAISGFAINCTDCPDLVPALCFFASYCGGRSTLSGLKSLVFKESDRIHELLKILSAFEIEHDYNESQDELHITSGARTDEPKELSLPHDHRIIMTAYLFLRYNGGGSFDNEDAVKKSFPHFFECMEGKL
jgi:3-phosphoshikimate 1-carboxyvinyltransferase